MRKYLRRRLRDYLALYIRPEGSVLEADLTAENTSGRMQRLFRVRSPGQTSTIVLELILLERGHNAETLKALGPLSPASSARLLDFAQHNT
ncbi:MAG: hypothetical protein DMF34_09645 [Verrucomicrobia bacterium]|nr:MAG: hypothetical protein DMF34_09645 [Verrucomicrobiota bacterium]